MATQNTNDQVLIISTIDTVPDLSQAITGTLSTNGINVVGDGTTTKFTTEFNNGDWLFNGTNQVNRIDQIYSDNIMYLIAPFDVDLPIFTPAHRVPASRTQQMGITANGTGATVNGMALTSGQSINYGSDLDSDRTLNPMVLNGTAATLTVIKGLQG